MTTPDHETHETEGSAGASGDTGGSGGTGGTGGFSRREFLGSAALTGAGAVVGLSYYFSRPKPRDFPAEPVRLGFIGVGNRGGSLLKSALKVPGNEPIAVADVRPAQRQQAIKDIRKEKEKPPAAAPGEPTPPPAPSYPVKEYDDYRRLLDDKDVEAVFIATPLYLHGPMAIDAIEAGKHVYCEKAMAFTIGENQDIYNLVRARNATEQKLVFQVGHQRHYSPLYQKVKRMIDEDVIGDVAVIRAQWNRNDKVRRPCEDPAQEKVINWRLYSEYSAGLTTEFASHQIDVANWLLGTHPDSVCGYGGVDWYDDGRDTHDNIHLVYNYRVPVRERDAYGRARVDAAGRPVFRTQDGNVVHRNVRFAYMSIMQNEHLGPSELILGYYGTLEVSLLGGEFFKEKKARMDPNRIAEGTNPRRALQKRVLRTGSTVDPSAAGLPRRKGDAIEVEPDRTHWVEFTGEIAGGYDKHETLLAVDSFLNCIRRARGGQPFADELKANVEIGLWGAVPALMANIAMREERTVYWREFFPGDETA